MSEDDKGKQTKDDQLSTTIPVQFVADARLISILGEQLIGSERVGVMELVKNAYDAAARNCTVTIEGVPGLEPSRRTLKDYRSLPGPIIEVRDDGTGMSEDDLTHGWLRPATPKRASVKERLRRERQEADLRGTSKEYEALVSELKEAHGGRLPLGEKGVGRLATHRLGGHLWLRTKTADDPLEWELRIDWSRFDAPEGTLLDLDEVQLDLVHQAPTAEYGRDECGTVICCYGGRDGYTWDHDSIVDLGRAVNALRSPHRGPKGFATHFKTPHAARDELAAPLSRVPAPFELVAIVDVDGKADIERRFTPPSTLQVEMDEAYVEERIDLRTKEKDYWAKGAGLLRPPECGPFLVHVRAWLRLGQDWMGPDHKALVKHLDRYGGLSLYRDGIAALPAEQSSKGDWLGLALAQIKKSSNISYYHLSGEVELTQEATLPLRDRSSREGLIDTRAYRDLAVLARAIVAELQFFMIEIRDQWSRGSSKSGPVSRAKLQSDARLVGELLKGVSERYDFEDDPLTLSKVVRSEEPAARLSQAADHLSELSDQLQLYEEERDGLLEAAGFGLAIAVAIHELTRIASGILADSTSAQALVDSSHDAAAVLESLVLRSRALRSEIKRVEPLRTTRSERSRSLSVRATIEAGKNAFVDAMSRGQVLFHIDGDDFSINGRFGAIAQVFANLFDNALYWMGTKGPGGALNVVIDAKKRIVIVADNGPGISLKMRPHLFQPFYSEKVPPSGLGLYISRYYLQQCRATIRPARKTERVSLSGAQFLLDFSDSPTEEAGQ